MANEKTDLEGIISEIKAGMVLFPQSEADNAWNNASKRAVSVVQRYQEGKGIFQIGTDRSTFGQSATTTYNK